MRKWLYFISLVFCWQALTAQVPAAGAQDPDAEAVMETETFDTIVTGNEDVPDPEALRQPYLAEWAADSLPSLRKDKAFGYMSSLDSQLRALNADPLPDNTQQQPEKRFLDEVWVRTLFWALAIAAVFFMLYRLLAGTNNLFSRNKSLDTDDETEVPKEKVKASNIALAQQAAAAGNFRLAVRYHYLYILQRMGEKNLVQLLPQKTNDRYLDEVKHLPLRHAFATLTLQYEYIWYGEFTISHTQYETIARGFRNYTESWL